MAFKRASEIATIDCVLITLTTEEDTPREIALDTASSLGVSPQMETKEAVKLVIKGALKAQKGKDVTITGNTITLKDNVFTPELVLILQGGTLKYWQDEEHTSEGATDKGFGVSSYIPPVAGKKEKSTFFTLNAYAAVYDASAEIICYEKITYPNCYGDPISMQTEDDVFRAPEYTINSAPAKGEAPYELHYVDELPDITETTAAG